MSDEAAKTTISPDTGAAVLAALVGRAAGAVVGLAAPADVGALAGAAAGGVAAGPGAVVAAAGADVGCAAGAVVGAGAFGAEHAAIGDPPRSLLPRHPPGALEAFRHPVEPGVGLALAAPVLMHQREDRKSVV